MLNVRLAHPLQKYLEMAFLGFQKTYASNKKKLAFTEKLHEKNNYTFAFLMEKLIRNISNGKPTFS